MSRKTREEKLVEQVVEAIGHTEFQPALFANLIVNQYELSTQEQLMNLVCEIIRFQARRMPLDWEAGKTSDALLLADTLVELINTIRAEDLNKILSQLPPIQPGPANNNLWLWEGNNESQSIKLFQHIVIDLNKYIKGQYVQFVQIVHFGYIVPFVMICIGAIFPIYDSL